MGEICKNSKECEPPRLLLLLLILLLLPLMLLLLLPGPQTHNPTGSNRTHTHTHTLHWLVRWQPAAVIYLLSGSSSRSSSSSQWCGGAGGRAGGIFRLHVGCRCCSTQPGHSKTAAVGFFFLFCFFSSSRLFRSNTSDSQFIGFFLK